ncbi:MAG TPA: sensor domain-containing diguanylate cyclase [Dehalococcoidia bacterium]|nr:sensor domain-containing diguanylate cyclase [Dehalococcoidia bacterium]
MLVVLATAAVAIAVVLFSVARIDHQARGSARQSQAALTAARLHADLAEPTLHLANGYLALFFAPSFQALPDDVKLAVRDDVATALKGEAVQQSSAFPMPMGDKELLGLHDRFGAAMAGVAQLRVVTKEDFDLNSIAARSQEMKSAFEAYLGENSLGNYNSLFSSVIRLRAELNLMSNAIIGSLVPSQAELNESTTFARYSMVSALLVLIIITAIATFFIARMLYGVFRASERERRELRETTAALSYRNDQLTALYNVFTEITETLSLRYVVRATLREALKVMSADMVVMRRLKDDELVPLGGLTGEGVESENLEIVPLGDGPTGRAARRGRTVHIRQGAQDQIGPNANRYDRMESGIVVPLIVGARVVGTLACWSHRADAFTDEDERVLEMMASQVATAVIAADTTDTNDHRAHHDPLTGLPNRLQLNNDVSRELGSLAAVGRQAVVAMVDIDHFKRFNDEFGHRVGDVTLQKVASVLRTAVRDRDHVYRYGGEEFVIVFVDAGASEAVALAEHVRAAVESTPLSGDQLEPVGPVAISIGLAILPDHATDFGNLIEMADAAMYKAKQSGRNRVVLWQDEASVPSLVA